MAFERLDYRRWIHKLALKGAFTLTIWGLHRLRYLCRPCRQRHSEGFSFTHKHDDFYAEIKGDFLTIQVLVSALRLPPLYSYIANLG